MITKLKKIFSFLASKPLHPQWLLFRHEEQRFKNIAEQANGLVLDIGCSEQKLRDYLSKDCEYIGLDYPDTANKMYKTKPTVYGDAQSLAFADNTFDTISFLEVLEHLSTPQAAVHDAPFYFQRLTIHGLRELFNKNNLKITDEKTMGNL